MNNVVIAEEKDFDASVTIKSQPKLMRFPTHGDDKGSGFLSVADNANLPFAVKGMRILTLSSSALQFADKLYPEQILISIKGQIEFETEMLSDENEKVWLIANETNLGIYIPQSTRGRVVFSDNAVVLQITSVADDDSLLLNPVPSSFAVRNCSLWF
jgi:hypothetical protein